ncbi:Sec-independent protein translocase protein TatB [Congregibacter litoralis]|uniref:Sec-independent protein translocase protein TatB n=1 Tax=Congregibacter litoralis KT71 TaxID=314285 RepID=A4A8N3_9GAMM|nr:Sec-independent protein translocase protein TatB [Congregibacter litoralis]EAQ97425.1 twin arginine-targeting protein translocase TatB [Congregibacter litoralis KT71]
MFDIGFAELLIIGVVALIVVGPERLPDAVRTASAWLNRLRRGFNDIKQEVQQELHNDAVMKDLKALKDSSEELRRETQSLGSDFKSSFSASKNDSSDPTIAAPADTSGDSGNTRNKQSSAAEESGAPESSEGDDQASPIMDRKAGD